MDRRAWSLRQTGAKGERDVNLRMGTGTRWLAFLLLTGCAMLLWGQRYRESRPPESLEALMDSEGIGIAILSVRTAKDSGQTRVLNRTPWWHRESIDPSTRLPIASLSKPITASVVRRLVVQGRLHLDTAAISLLPELRTLPDPRASRITVRHLLQHTSGLDQSAGDPMFHAGAPIGCRGAIAASLSRRLETPPGTRMRYSNTGYCLLGEIISRATGESYEIATRRLLGELASDGLEMGTAAGAPPHVMACPATLCERLGQQAVGREMRPPWQPSMDEMRWIPPYPCPRTHPVATGSTDWGGGCGGKEMAIGLRTSAIFPARSLLQWRIPTARPRSYS